MRGIRMRLVLAVAFLTASILLAACGDDDNAPSRTPAGTYTGTPTETAGMTATGSPTGGETYTNERFGYSVVPPSGWRRAYSFMDYGGTAIHPHGIGYSGGYDVFTDMPEDDERALVERARSSPTGLTGVSRWSDFFLLRTVEIYPTSATREQLLTSVSDGNVWHLVTNVRDVELASGQIATRFDLDISNDHGRFVYDTVFVPTLENCARCRGFIIETASGGIVSSGPLGTAGVPPAAYPKSEFEWIVTNFQAELLESVLPAFFEDPYLGFSFSYPGDLVLTDLTGPTPGAGRERVLYFKSADNRRRGLVVAWYDDDPASLKEWAIIQAACVPDSITPTVLGGVSALSCQRAVFGPTEPAVLAEHDGRIFLITSGLDLRDFEFADIIANFEF
jgi:hypothetical protein